MVLDRLAQILERQILQFSIQLKVMTEEETKEYHLKKLYQLSLKSIGQLPQLDKPTYDQKVWVLFRLSNPNTWPKVQENKIGDWKNWR